MIVGAAPHDMSGAIYLYLMMMIQCPLKDLGYCRVINLIYLPDCPKLHELEDIQSNGQTLWFGDISSG